MKVYLKLVTVSAVYYIPKNFNYFLPSLVLMNV